MILDFSRWRILTIQIIICIYIYYCWNYISIYQLLILFLIFLLKFNRVFLFLTLRFFFFSSYSIKILLLRKPETFSFLFLFLVAEMFHKYQFFLTLVKIFPLPLGFTQSPYYLSSRKIYCNETRKQFIFDESKCTERKRLII